MYMKATELLKDVSILFNEKSVCICVTINNCYFYPEF